MAEVELIPENDALVARLVQLLTVAPISDDRFGGAINWMRGELMSASLDHAIWFHEDCRVDDWLLYSCHSPWTGGARSMNFGSIYTRDGRLVATAAQEGLMRAVTPKG